jgi:hypothetical protein
MKQKKYYVHRNPYNQVGLNVTIPNTTVPKPGAITIDYSSQFNPPPSSSGKTVTIGYESTQQQTTGDIQNFTNQFESISKKYANIGKSMK